MDSEWHERTVVKLMGPQVASSFWEDSMLIAPAVTYVVLFCNPRNMVLDLEGDGVVLFHTSDNGTRASLYTASWGKRAMRCPKARRFACRAAFCALGVQRLEAFTRADNKLARRALEEAGFHFSGPIPSGLWYNKIRVPGVWYEMDRKDFGLAPLALE